MERETLTLRKGHQQHAVGGRERGQLGAERAADAVEGLRAALLRRALLVQDEHLRGEVVFMVLCHLTTDFSLRLGANYSSLLWLCAPDCRQGYVTTATRSRIMRSNQCLVVSYPIYSVMIEKEVEQGQQLPHGLGLRTRGFLVMQQGGCAH